MLTVLKLPEALKTIEAGAFQNVSANVVDLRSTQVSSIGDGAFSGCVDMVAAYLPSSVKFIGDGAFYGCLNLVIFCEQGSEAEAYAVRNGFETEYMN